MDSDCRQKSSAPTVLKCYRNGLQQSGSGEKAEAEACEGECKSLRGRHQRRRIGSGYVVVIVLRDRHGNHDTDQFLQIGAVTIGAAAILKTSPWLYHTLRVAGGGYLVWLGIQRIRTEPGTGSEPSAVPRHVMSSSALIEAVNPKSALFYLSFLLQFVDTTISLGVGWQLLLLGVSANLLF